MISDKNGMIHSEEDDLLIIEEDVLPENTGHQPDENSWKLLIVDDDQAVHDVTKLALKQYKFANRVLSFISAYSGAEAKQLMTHHSDINLILLDVVMEKPDAGLTVVKYIRDVLGNDLVRIIMRTGQPDQIPEETIIHTYDINDYKTKAELTRQKLFTTISVALRSFEDLVTLQRNQKELERLYSDLEKRNHDLEATNSRLQEEMQERKKLEAVRLEEQRLRLENKFLEEQSQALTKLNADKDKFFSIVSHDLRAPFNVLLGASRFLEREFETLSPQNVRELAQSIYISAESTHNLLENLLAWARMQLEGMRFCPTEVDLYQLTQETIRPLQKTAAAKDIQILNLIGPNMAAYADSDMLSVVIRNLVANALKFTPNEGSITILAQHPDPAEFKPPGNQNHQDDIIEVEISDTGIGISQEKIDKLFNLGDPQISYGTKGEKGTGLGLIICKEMIERHNGQLRLESTVDVGTTVKFTLNAA